MKIQIDRNKDTIDVRKVTIFLGETEFEIEINKFNELIIRKEQFDNNESCLIIRPKVSNEIGLK